MTEGDLRKAIALHKAGNRVGARHALAEIVRNEPRNEIALLWLAGSVDGIDQKRLCLQRALDINPTNQNTILALQQLETDIPQPSLEDLSTTYSAAPPDPQPTATATLVEGAIHPPDEDSRIPVPTTSGPPEQMKQRQSAKTKPLSATVLVLVGALVMLCLGSFAWAAYSYVQRLNDNSQPVAILVTSVAPTEVPAQNTTAATPVATATVAPTATPDLFTGSAKSLVPNQADMPDGFVLDPGNSGPVQVDSADGYGSSYLNQNNVYSFEGDAIIAAFTVYVPLSTKEAEALYQNIAGGAADKMTATVPGTVVNKFAQVHVTVPHVEEAVALCGTVQGPGFPTTVCSIVFRVKNVVVWTFDAANDLSDAQPSILDQAEYFASLVVEKLR